MEKFWNTVSSLFKRLCQPSIHFNYCMAIIMVCNYNVVCFGTLSSHQFQQRLTNVVDKQTKKLFSASITSTIQSIRKNQIKIKEIKARIYELLKS